jgi:hypothetical protein
VREGKITAKYVAKSPPKKSGGKWKEEEKNNKKHIFSAFTYTSTMIHESQPDCLLSRHGVRVNDDVCVSVIHILA